MTEPGWFPDPHVPGQLRWWDGSTWTTHVATPTAGGPGPGGAAPVGPPGYPMGAPGGPGAPGPPTSMAPAPASTGRRGWLIGLGVVAAVVVVAGVLSLPFLLRSGPEATTATVTTTTPTTSGGRSSTTDAEPEEDSELTAAAALADIPVLDEEGAATHTHTMLHIYLDGDEVTVPAGIGIDPRAGQIAAVHTHEDTGVLHVESPTANDTYTIGQFLTLWGTGEDDDALCEAIAEGPCEVTYDVVAPTEADEETFDGYGSMPSTPPLEADGRDTELAQGAVIEIDLTTP